MTSKLLFLAVGVTLTFGCGGSSNDRGGTHHGGASGTAGASAAGGKGGTGADGGSSGTQGGHNTGGNAGSATRGGSSSGATGGGAGVGAGGTAGTAGTSSSAGNGSGGRNRAGTGGGGSAGRANGTGGAAGEAGGGAAGMSGAAGSDGTGTMCGGLAAKMCDPGQWCHWANGSCGIADQPGECFDSGGVTCAPGSVCGCDGHAYSMACRAHADGVDTTADKACVPGDGAPGDPCFVDTDCSGTLKCCTSPIGLMTCTSVSGATCPLTP